MSGVPCKKVVSPAWWGKKNLNTVQAIFVFGYNIREGSALDLFVPRNFTSVQAAIQLGIAVPPLRSLRPGLSEAPCKKVLIPVTSLGRQGMLIVQEGRTCGEGTILFFSRILKEWSFDIFNGFGQPPSCLVPRGIVQESLKCCLGTILSFIHNIKKDLCVIFLTEVI